MAAASFLDERLNYEKLVGEAYTRQVFKLDRVRELYRRVGSPAAQTPTVHCTGTKGKGSTLALLAAILQKAGYSTGFFHSPHLERIEERFLVNGQPCEPAEFQAALDRLEPVVAKMDADERAGRTDWGLLTWFEIVTMAAWLIFEARHVDVVLLEVGMGGRLDSTNICQPLVSIITNVSLDHVAQLGDTVEKIAFEKAGIIKPHTPVVSGVTQPGVVDVVRRVALEQQAPLYLVDSETTFPVGMHGQHQKKNAALAIQAVEILRQNGLEIPDEAIREGLKTAFLPGRLEIVAEKPTVILDVAHNIASIATTCDWLNEAFPTQTKRVVFAVSGDKDWREMLDRLALLCERVYLTHYTLNPRGLATETLAAYCEEAQIPFTVVENPRDAVARAMKDSKPEDVVLVVGSFFLVGEVAGMLRGGR